MTLAFRPLQPFRVFDGVLLTRDFTEFDFAYLPLDSRITFTRASAGTYFDANGVMQTAAIDQPRIDHDPVTGGVRGLLVEEQRTNLVKSSGFSGAGWASLNVLSVESADGPGGAGTARKITATGGGPCYVAFGYNTAEFNSLPLWASSVYVKAGSYKYARLSQSTAANAQPSITINLENGSYSGSAVSWGTTTVTNIGGGWYRITLSRNIVYQYPCFALYLTNYSGPSDAGVVNAGTYPAAGEFIYAWAPQFEANASFASSYIPTEGTAMTRGADAAVVPNLADIRLNPAAGTFLVEHDAPAGRPLLSSGANLIAVSQGPGVLAVAYDGSGSVVYQNGVSAGSGAALSFDTGLRIGASASEHANACIRRARYYSRKLSPSEIAGVWA